MSNTISEIDVDIFRHLKMMLEIMDGAWMSNGKLSAAERAVYIKAGAKRVHEMCNDIIRMDNERAEDD